MCPQMDFCNVSFATYKAVSASVPYHMRSLPTSVQHEVAWCRGLRTDQRNQKAVVSPGDLEQVKMGRGFSTPAREEE